MQNKASTGTYSNHVNWEFLSFTKAGRNSFIVHIHVKLKEFIFVKMKSPQLSFNNSRCVLVKFHDCRIKTLPRHCWEMIAGTSLS